MPDNSQDLPLPKQDQPKLDPRDPAISLIKKKLDYLYANEPSAKEEEEEIKSVGAQSKHQKFMQDLMDSGKNLAQVQAAWHEYYQNLSDNEKHQVWHEFYENQNRGSEYIDHISQQQSKTKQQKQPEHKPPQNLVGKFIPSTKSIETKVSTTADSIKKHLLDTVSARGKFKPKHHLQSLLFGLSMGLLAVFVVMFAFFNERFIAPFITPSRNVTSTPIIIDPTKTVSKNSVVIIPKINVEVPVVYGLDSIKEKTILGALDSGVVHYPTTPVPGQNGNVAIVGHSSNNIFNSGKYKFAFVLLSRLEEDDTFILTHKGKQYLYRVYEKKIVAPTDVAVLGPTDKQATATLITCDPPGTALHRLVVIGEQISPDPAANSKAAKTTIEEQPASVPGESESLFHRLFGWIWD